VTAVEKIDLGHGVIVGVVVLLVLMIYVGHLIGWLAEAETLQPVTISKYEQQFVELDRAAITQAYRDQIYHLFSVWAKDHSGQPKRAVTGARQARIMYEQAMTVIEEREQRLSGSK
jgi:hypothetical protein